MLLYPYLSFRSENHLVGAIDETAFKIKKLWHYSLNIYDAPHEFQGNFNTLEDMIDWVLNIDSELIHRPTCDYDFDEMVFQRLFEFCLEYKNEVDSIE